MGVAAGAHGVWQQHAIEPGVDDTVAGAQGDAAPGHDEVGQGMLGVDIDGLWICGSMTKGLHGQVRGKTQAGQVLELVPRHGPRSILAAHRGHLRLAVGARANAFHATGAADHFLCQRVTLAGIDRLLRRAEQLRRGQVQGFASPGGQSAANNQVDAAAGANLVQQDLGLQAEFAEGFALVVENLAVIGADFDHLAHVQLLHVRFEYQCARIFHGVVENRRDLAADTDAAALLVRHTGHVLAEEPEYGVGRGLAR